MSTITDQPTDQQYGFYFYLADQKYILQSGKYHSSICRQKITTVHTLGKVYGTAIAFNPKEAVLVAQKLIEQEYQEEVEYLKKLGFYDWMVAPEPKPELDPLLELLVSCLKGKNRKYLPMNNPDYPIEIM